MGDLREYFATPECEVPPDHVVYWQAWEREFEQFHMVDVDCHNHVLMLTEDVPRQAIVPACARLYAVEGEAPSLRSGRDVQPRNTDSLEREPLST